MSNFFVFFLGQLVFYLLLWLYDDYLASILSLIIGAICLSIWVLSYLFELIEKTRINRSYFTFMLAGFLAPLCGFIFYLVFGGGFGWLE